MRVSEYFYSIQGEGQYQGYPAVFFRMQGCNLLCGMPKDDDLTKPCEGCKWVCDTIAQWRKGEPKTVEEVVAIWETFMPQFKAGAHLVLTGGEPLMQQKELTEALMMFEEKHEFLPFVEVETNGTIKPTNDFQTYVDRFNVSVKLSNSGNAKEKRYNPIAIEFHAESFTSIFKFVTLDDEDLEEITKDFIEPFHIPDDKIWLMPGAYNRDMLWKNGVKVAELCKKKGWKMTSRMHVEIWDRLTGV